MSPPSTAPAPALAPQSATAPPAPPESPAPQGRGSSQYLGVCWDKQNRRWVVHIGKHGKQTHVGCFTDEIEAAKAYDAEARKAYGKWATPNFPTDAERAFAAQWYDLDAAARFFGISRFGWKNWIRAGVIKGGRMVRSPRGGMRKVYTLEELQRIKEDLFGEDKLYKDGKTGRYHVPEGLVTRQEAWAMFGVNKVTWERWEREGKITCGERIYGGPKVYKIEDIKRLLEENGSYSPPYPDPSPDSAGCWRVPLSGHDIRRREAIIDAESLPLIEGGRCSWSIGYQEVGFVALSHPDEPPGTPLRRVIMGVVDSDLNVSHKNGDPLDCRRENLIAKTTSQRVRGNCKMKEVKGKPPTSRYKGVFWETWSGKWRARIVAQGKNHSLGRFYDEIDAAECYDIAARRYFGKHAWLNFPGEGERGFAETTDCASRAAA